MVLETCDSHFSNHFGICCVSSLIQLFDQDAVSKSANQGSKVPDNGTNCTVHYWKFSILVCLLLGRVMHQSGIHLYLDLYGCLRFIPCDFVHDICQ
jgi:hypothetical protein